MKRVLILATALALSGGQSFAHAFLDTAVPKVGSTVTAAPKEIRIEFTQGIEPAFSHIGVFTADGTAVAMGQAALDPNDPQMLVVPVTEPLAPGHYEVRWSVISVDTHHTDGHFPFDYQP